jgi:hypothetical protein
VRYIGGRTIYRCQTGGPKKLPEFDKPRDPDASSKKQWAEVPEPVRKDVEQHVSANLPDDLLAKLRELHARGLPISHDDAFFHFGGGMAVRNLCRERLSDKELAACCLFGNWDDCYIGVLAAIAAVRQ